MKKFLLSTFVLITFTVYALRNNLVGKDVQGVAIKSSDPIGSTPVASTRTGKYKDGTYTGSVADAFYGNIQVRAVISGGKITDVIFLQYPNDRRTSIEINSQAMPMLKQEAISAQSAQVDGVSGATATSQAFIQSLAGALSQAI